MAHWSHSFESEDYKRALRRWLESSEHAWFISPFVTKPALDILSEAAAKIDVRLITRFYEEDVLGGFIDLSALADFIDAGGQVRFHDRYLHAKLWIFDEAAFLGSVNLTGRALSGNLEAMAQLDPATSRPGVKAFFRDLWKRLESSQRSSSTLRSEANRLRVHPLAHRFRATALGLRDLGGVGVAEPAPATGATTWLKINGRAEERITDGDHLRDWAIGLGGETVSDKGRPRLKAGDPVIFGYLGFHDGKNDLCIYGRGFVDIAHREGIDELPAWVKSVVDSTVWETLLRRWPYIFWLRDVQIANVRASEAVWLSDINRPEQVLPPRSYGQKSYIRLNDRRFAAFNTALDDLFLRVPPIVRERPEGLWWNRHLPLEHHLSRTRLEVEARRQDGQAE